MWAAIAFPTRPSPRSAAWWMDNLKTEVTGYDLTANCCYRQALIVCRIEQCFMESV